MITAYLVAHPKEWCSDCTLNVDGATVSELFVAFCNVLSSTRDLTAHGGADAGVMGQPSHSLGIGGTSVRKPG